MTLRTALAATLFGVALYAGCGGGEDPTDDGADDATLHPVTCRQASCVATVIVDDMATLKTCFGYTGSGWPQDTPFGVFTYCDGSKSECRIPSDEVSAQLVSDGTCRTAATVGDACDVCEPPPALELDPYVADLVDTLEGYCGLTPRTEVECPSEVCGELSAEEACAVE